MHFRRGGTNFCGEPQALAFGRTARGLEVDPWPYHCVVRRCGRASIDDAVTAFKLRAVGQDGCRETP